MARFRFKQRPLNDKQKIGSPYQLTDGERLLSIVVTVVNFSADKYLGFHDTTFSILSSLFKVQ